MRPLFVCLALTLITCTDRTKELVVCDQWTSIHNQYAKSFEIRTCGALRELIVHGPEGITDTLSVYRIALDASDNNALRPLQRVAVVSTTHLAYIHALGCIDRVVGAAGMERVLDPIVKAKLEKQDAREIGTADGLDREGLIHLAPEALLDQPFGKSDLQGKIPGIPTIMISEYLEQHPLGRAEWLRFFGVLFGKEAEADSLFRSIESRYIAAQVQLGQTDQRTEVFFGSAWQGTWWVPGGKSYMAQLLADAGGVLLFSDTASVENRAVDIETLLHEGPHVKKWGMVIAEYGPIDGAVLSAGDARIRSLSVFKSDGLFAANSMRSDVFGKAFVEPDVVLLDLVKILHPGSAMDHNAVYFKAFDSRGLRDQ